MNRFGVLIIVLLVAASCSVFSGGCGQDRALPSSPDGLQNNLSYNISSEAGSSILQAYNCVAGQFLYSERIPSKFFSLTGATLEAALYADYASVAGFIRSLGDPHTRYVLPGEDNVDAILSGGSFAGIGVTLIGKAGKIRLVYVFPDGPAKLAGLQNGDVVAKIDDQLVDGLPTSEVANLIRGLPETTIKLEILRNGTPLIFNLIRRYINTKNVYCELMPGNVGYIKILQFGYSSSADFIQAYNEIAGQAAGLIIDLRGNGGGELSNALRIAAFFVPDGQAIMWYKDRWSEIRKITAPSGTKITLPVVIVVDELSASASELLAASLIDNGLAEAVGTRTYGKGLVQSRYELSDESRIYLTVAEFFSPKQQKITGLGITPKIFVTLSEADFMAGRDSQLTQALAELGKWQKQARVQAVGIAQSITVKTLSLPIILEKAVDVPVGDGIL